MSEFIIIFLNVYFRECVCASKGGAEMGGAGTEDLQADSSEPDTGLELTNCEIMTWAEVGHLRH